METRVVTDVLPHYPNSIVTFYRRGGTFTLSESFPGAETSVTTNGSGAYSADLWPNAEGLSATHYLAVYPGNETFEFVLEDDPSPITGAELRAQESWNWDENPPPSLIDLERARYANAVSSSLGAALMGYLASGTGAIGRTARDRMDEHWSLVDFGILPANTAAVNGPRLVAAIAALSARGGGDLYIPPGKHDFDTGITLDGSIRLWGAGRESRLHYTGNATALTINGDQPNILEHFDLSGTSAAAVGLYLRKGTSSNTRINNIRIYDFDNVSSDSVGIGWLIDAVAELGGGIYYGTYYDVLVNECHHGLKIVTSGWVWDEETEQSILDPQAGGGYNNAHTYVNCRFSLNLGHGVWILGSLSHTFITPGFERNDGNAIKLEGGSVNGIGGWFEGNDLGHIWIEEDTSKVTWIGGQWSTRSVANPTPPVVGPGAENPGNLFLIDYMRTDFESLVDDTFGEGQYQMWLQAMRANQLDIRDELIAVDASIHELHLDREWDHVIVGRTQQAERIQTTTATAAAAEGASTIRVSNTDTSAAAITFANGQRLQIQIAEALAQTTTIASFVNNGDGTTTITLAAPLANTSDPSNNSVVIGSKVHVRTQLADSASRFRLSNRGSLDWGNGTDSPDVRWERVGAGIMTYSSSAVDVDGFPVGGQFRVEHFNQRGFVYQKYRTVSANTTVLTTDRVIGVDTTAGPVTITLPTAVSSGGSGTTVAEVVIKHVLGDAAANPVTVVVDGGGTIDGAANKVINVSRGVLRFAATNASWMTL